MFDPFSLFEIPVSLSLLGCLKRACLKRQGLKSKKESTVKQASAVKHKEKKSGVNKKLVALGLVGGILLIKRLFKKKEKEGYYQGLGKKVDQRLSGLADKVGSLKK